MQSQLFTAVYLLLLFSANLGATTNFSGNQAAWVGIDLNNELCKGNPQGFGPYDYTNIVHRKQHLPIVETYHFTPEIQSLSSKPSAWIADIDYTLRAFPNHHRALNLIIQYNWLYQDDIAKKRKPKLLTPVECYFQRAIHFAPHDGGAQALYATYLKKIKHFDEADKYYQLSISTEPEQLVLRYNYAMFLVMMKKYEQAREHAKIIYAKGFRDKKLKEKLKAVGYWQE